jgi:hypothetical protein
MLCYLSPTWMFNNRFDEHQSLTKVAQQSVTRFIGMNLMNFVTPKVGAEHELLFNKPASVVLVRLK